MNGRTVADVEAQADADSRDDPPLTQETADQIAGILAAAPRQQPEHAA